MAEFSLFHIKKFLQEETEITEKVELGRKAFTEGNEVNEETAM